MPEPGKTLHLSGWPRGLNRTTHPALLQNDELAEAFNIDLGPRGEAALRKGHQPYLMDGAAHTGAGFDYIWCTCPPTPDSLEDAPEPIVAVRATGEIDIHPYGTNVGDLGTWLGQGPKLITMNDKYYLSGASRFVVPYEISISSGGVVTATLKTVWDGVSDQTNQFPNSRIMAVVYDRVFAVKGAVTHKLNSRLFFSEPLLPLTWKAANFIDIGPDDTDGITAITYMADQIIIFKEHSIWGIAGTDFSTTANLAVYKIADVGAINEQSIVHLPQGLLFVDAAQGIYVYDGSEIRNVGVPIFQHIQDGWNPAHITEVTGWRHQDQAYISVPWGSQTTPSRTFVWDGVLDAWAEHTMGMAAVGKRHVTQGAEHTTAGGFERVVGVRANTGGDQLGNDNIVGTTSGVVALFESSLDDDIAIHGWVKTGYISPDTAMASHRFKRLGFLFSGTALTTPVFLFVDGNEATHAASIVVSSGSQEFIRTRALNRPRWRMMQLAFEFNTTPFDAAPGPKDTTVYPWQLSEIVLEYGTLPGIRTSDPT